MQDGGGMATYYIYTVSGGKVKLCGECTTRGISSDPPIVKYEFNKTLYLDLDVGLSTKIEKKVQECNEIAQKYNEYM